MGNFDRKTHFRAIILIMLNLNIYQVIFKRKGILFPISTVRDRIKNCHVELTFL